MADRRHDDLGGKGIVGVDGLDLAGEVDADMAKGIQPAHERADVQAPHLAASKACKGENVTVTFVLMPSAVNCFTALSPSRVLTTFTTTFLCRAAKVRPSARMSLA